MKECLVFELPFGGVLSKNQPKIDNLLIQASGIKIHVTKKLFGDNGLLCSPGYTDDDADDDNHDNDEKIKMMINDDDGKGDDDNDDDDDDGRRGARSLRYAMTYGTQPVIHTHRIHRCLKMVAH